MKKYFSIVSLFLFSTIFIKPLYGLQQNPYTEAQNRMNYVNAYGNALLKQYGFVSCSVVRGVQNQIQHLISDDQYFENPLIRHTPHNRMVVQLFFASSISASVAYGSEMISSHRNFAIHAFSDILTTNIPADFHAPLTNHFMHILDFISIRNQEELHRINHSSKSQAMQEYLRRLHEAQRHRGLMPNIHAPEVLALTGAVHALPFQ